MGAPSVEQEIMSLEYAWMNTGYTRDRQTCERLMADEFVLISTWGGVGATVLGKEGWLERSFGTIEVHTFAFHDPHVEITGETALVEKGWSQEATINGQDWSIEARLTDVWARRDGQWQVVSRYSRPSE